MTDETPESFEAFEAKATSTEPPVAADETVTGDVVEEGNASPNADEGESGSENKGDENDDAENGSESEEKGKKRSKPASQRIAEITKARHEADRRAEAAEARAEAAEARLRDGAPKHETAKEPSPDDYEFGEADPGYIKALAKFEVRAELDAERAKEAEAAQAEKITAEGQRLDANWSEMAEKAVEKYPDFKETVVETAAAAEWPLMPLCAAAVANAPNGDDIAYHLATNRDDAEKLADLELKFHNARAKAVKAGLSKDMIALMVEPYLDRATEFYQTIEGKVKGREAPKAKTVTDAPEPPKHNVRGAGGRYDVGADTSDFAAFEAKAKREAAR